MYFNYVMKRLRASAGGHYFPLFMRLQLTIIGFLLVVSQAIALPGFAQRFTLSKKNASLEEVFAEMRKQSGYDFIVDGQLLRKGHPVDVHLVDVTVTEALDKLLSDQPLTYTIHDNTVVIKAREISKTTVRLQTTVTGQVTDAAGNPINGVSIAVKTGGKTIGVQQQAFTAENGSYSIRVPAENAILVFSHLAFTTAEVPINGRAQINISLQERSNELDETVVIAYGSQRRKNITGSVATISADQLQDLPPVVNLEESLKGFAAGVMVQQENGQPGAATRVRIRGSASLLGSNQPLYVVDGVPVLAESNIPDDGSARNTEMLNLGLNSPLNNLNPADIESISVLKDASATAIYGSRAAGGVVIITTKSGSAAGKPVFQFNSSLAIQQAQVADALNANQFRDIWTEAANNSTLNNPFINSVRDGSYFGTANTDWAKEAGVNNAVTRQVNFSASGGNERLRYFTSLGYTGNDGVIRNSAFDRYNLLSKIEISATDFLKIGANINLSTSDQLSTPGASLSNIYTYRPDIPVYNPDGSFTYSPFSSQENPVARTNILNTNQTNLLVGSIFAEANFARYFVLRSALSINYNNGNQRSYYPGYTNLGGYHMTNGPGDGYAQESSSRGISRLWENTLNYNQRFSDIHHVDGVVGASWQGDSNSYLKASGRGFAQDEILTNLSSATRDLWIGSHETQWGLISFFGRANYTLLDRYLFTASARTDGSSKFGTNNQWAFFPTFAAGWRISEEPFMQWAGFVQELKLRASWGLTGQQNFGPYQWRALYEANNYDGRPGYSQLQLGNAGLRWEVTPQTDIGLDFSLFNGRLSGAVDYYDRLTRDALFHMQTPLSTGFTTTIANLGSVRNRGIELTIEGDLIRRGDFTWSMMVNASRNRNRLETLNEDFLNSTTGIISPPGGGSLRLNQPLGLHFGYVADGIIQSQEQLDQLNAQAHDGIYHQPGTAPGDILFRDITGPNGVPDGKITSLDQTVIGNPMPNIWGGFSSTFRYKGLRLTAMFNYTVGNDILWVSQSQSINFVGTTLPSYGENKLAMVMDRWTPERPTDQPRAVYGDPNRNYLTSSYYVHDGSFLRLNNLYLEYNLPQNLLSRTNFFNNIQLFGSARNLLTITKYPGADPEVSHMFNNDLNAGRDLGYFPVAKTFTFGIRAGF